MAASILVQSRFDIQLGADMLNCVLTIAGSNEHAECIFAVSIRNDYHDYGIVFDGRAETSLLAATREELLVWLQRQLSNLRDRSEAIADLGIVGGLRMIKPEPISKSEATGEGTGAGTTRSLNA